MLSEMYNSAVALEKDMKFMVESVVTDPIENPEEEEVDVESVPQGAIDKADAALEQIVDRDDYDDTDLEELLDDDDEEFGDDEFKVIIEECVNTMDSFEA